ncbi:hypothetical protein ACWDFR_35585 [Streptomyces sp. 900105755]
MAAKRYLIRTGKQLTQEAVAEKAGLRTRKGAPAHRRISAWMNASQLPQQLTELKRLVNVLMEAGEISSVSAVHPGHASHGYTVQRQWEVWLNAARASRIGSSKVPRPQSGDASAAQLEHEEDDETGETLGWALDELAERAAIDLEVHPSIQNPLRQRGLDFLPAYVPRAHDDWLALRAKQAADGQSALAVLIGDSSTGKSRACWEVLDALPHGWRIWHPLVPNRAEALAAGLADPSKLSQTVLWLNELQHYLLTQGSDLGERNAAGLRELLRSSDYAPVLVLASLWPGYRDTLITTPEDGRPDPHSNARQLLLGHCKEVPHSFTGRRTLATLCALAAHDARLAEARERAEDGQITQYLAGVPAVIHRFDTAPAYARAVLEAAVDVARLGRGLLVPEAFLRSAAEGYLTRQQIDERPRSWFASALAYATDARQCRGARAPLTCCGNGEPNSETGFYRVTDVLLQWREEQSSTFPRKPFWTAAAEHISSPADRTSLARQAESRGRLRIALELMTLGGAPTDIELALGIHEQAGHLDVVQELVLERARTGHVDAITSTGRAWKQKGHHARAEELALRAAEEGFPGLLADLISEDPAPLRIWQKITAGGLPRIWGDLVESRGPVDLSGVLFHFGEPDETPFDPDIAVEVFGRTPDRGRIEDLWAAAALRELPLALGKIARAMERAGAPTEAENLWRMAGAGGLPHADGQLALLRLQAGDLPDAEQLALRSGSSSYFLSVLARAQQRSGHKEEGARLVLLAATRTDADLDSWEVLREMVASRDSVGDEKGAEQLAVAAADAGNFWALTDMVCRRVGARQWAKAGRPRVTARDWRTAERLALVCAEASHTSALEEMAESREREPNADKEEADRLWRRAYQAGSARAFRHLAWSYQRAGNLEGVHFLLSQAVASPPREDWSTWAQLYDLVGREQDAEDMLRRGLAADDHNSLEPLVRRYETAGHATAVEDLVETHSRYDTYDSLATQLALRREAAGDREGAERIALRAAKIGHTWPLARLTEQQEEAGELSAAESLLRRAIELRASSQAQVLLAELLYRRDDPDEAGRLIADLLRNDRHAVISLIKSKCDSCDWDAAEELVLLAAKAGDFEPLQYVANERASHAASSDEADRGAERLWRRAADVGHPDAFVALAELRRHAGDPSGARRLIQEAADAGHRRATELLALEYEREGNGDEAERLAARADRVNELGGAKVGSAIVTLAKMRQRSGDRESAEQLWQEAADAGERGAVEGLATLHEQAGDYATAEQIRRFGLDDTGQPASAW